MSDVTAIGAQAIYCGKKCLLLCVNDDEYGTWEVRGFTFERFLETQSLAFETTLCILCMSTE